ncbi:LysM peptidoglycan-binding domain-containing protein [Micrococcaceae bacterium Sec5.8]
MRAAANSSLPDRRRGLGADAAAAAAILLLGLVLAGTGGSILLRWRSSSSRHQSLGFEDQLGIAANTAGLIVIVWWALSLFIAVVAACLERRGNLRAASATGRFAPAFMRRLALATLGLHLLTAPLAVASTAAPVPDAAVIPKASVAWTPTALPAGTGTAADTSAPVPGPTPRPGQPAANPAVAGPQWQPLSPVVDPGPLAAQPPRHQQPSSPASEVTVRPGDSLWSLSAARLGPFASDVDIAVDWPRLYQANKDIIGGNPNLLRPGQVLRLPASE